MSGMTSYLQKKLSDHALGLTAYTMPTTVYLSLHTADPTDTGSLAYEVTTTASAYARQAITSKMNATDATTGISSSSSLITFGPATTDWGTIAYVATHDALTGGNMLMSGALTEVQTTPIGESVQFSPGQLLQTFA